MMPRVARTVCLGGRGEARQTECIAEWFGLATMGPSYSIARANQPLLFAGLDECDVGGASNPLITPDL